MWDFNTRTFAPPVAPSLSPKNELQAELPHTVARSSISIIMMSKAALESQKADRGAPASEHRRKGDGPQLSHVQNSFTQIHA